MSKRRAQAPRAVSCSDFGFCRLRSCRWRPCRRSIGEDVRRARAAGISRYLNKAAQRSRLWGTGRGGRTGPPASRKTGSANNVRTLDAIHLASAMIFQSGSRLTIPLVRGCSAKPPIGWCPPSVWVDLTTLRENGSEPAFCRMTRRFSETSQTVAGLISSQCGPKAPSKNLGSGQRWGDRNCLQLVLRDTWFAALASVLISRMAVWHLIRPCADAPSPPSP